MQCPACQSETSSNTGRCRVCDAPLVADEIATTLMPSPVAAGRGSTPAREPVRTSGFAELTAGAVLQGRYEILKTLGQGGMGAVYKARDREVDRVVALKVIRPELANQPEILSRFKQELILSRQVTHKNVVRIFDLGEAEGTKFITMEFVEGCDLRTLLRDKGPITTEQKVKIMIQVCRALSAAHAEGVVHRDLKPQNIMVDDNGRVVVMDFGIAHSMEAAGVTSTGVLVGTPAYVSPEQAKGEKIDPRSDIYTLGIVFYEALTGMAPFQSETVIGLLLKRIQERPVPPIDRNKDIPQALSDIVVKCMAVDREDRYQTAEEVERDLQGWLGSPTTFRTVVGTQIAREGVGKTPEGHTIVTPRMAMMAESGAWKWITISVVVAVVVIAGVFAALKLTSKPAGPHAPVTVVIADISNHTGDPIFDGTLEPMLKLALEGAGFIAAYDRTQMRGLGVRPIPVKLDEPAARQIAINQGLGVVISGSLDRQSNSYTLSLKAAQAVTGEQIAIMEESAPNKDQVLSAATKIAASVRKALGDHTSESAQRFAMETLSATSLEAVHEYALGMTALANGKNADALRSFSKAVDLDVNFGLAHAGKAIASRNLGQHADAEKNIKDAISHIDRMTERERYRTRGMFYFITGDYQKCVEEYGALTARYASDVSAHNNLGICYSYLRNIPKMIEETRRASEILPKRVLYRFNLAAFESLASDFPAAERDVRATLQMEPSYERGYLILAMAQLGQDQLSQAAETYHKLEKISDTGASYAASGLADLAMYEGRFSDAVRILSDGAAADLAAKQLDRAAEKFAPLAYTELLRGRKGPALAAADTALKHSKEVKVRLLAGLIFAQLGESAKARALADGLGSELQAEPQAYGKMIAGEIALKAGSPRDAVRSFTEANGLLDTWIGRFELGRAYLDAGAFAEADSEFDRCIKRRGEAILLFMDEVPTYGYFPPVYYDQGRVREGLKSSGAAGSFQAYLNIRQKAGEDPMLAEIRRRAGR
jgi:tetratricopeptide (TPR) repeat protein/predicted Ser/Thr protein kinase